jgi:hypothetical protein
MNREIGRLVLRTSKDSTRKVNGFSTFVNIPNLKLDSDDYVYIRIEHIDHIGVYEGSISNRYSHLNLISDLPQYPSYDSGNGNAASMCRAGQCRQLLSMHIAATGHFNPALKRHFGVWQYPRVPIKCRVDAIQGKMIWFGLEFCDGTPLTTSQVSNNTPSITLVIYK